jgi:hypothetical protein
MSAIVSALGIVIMSKVIISIVIVSFEKHCMVNACNEH